ncbi:MAG: HYC_CC_PP family protein [Bacteroidota bacterium]
MKPFISIFMALFVFFSSVGMAKTTHFCMGYAMNSEIGFGQKHLDCGMAMPMDHSENKEDNKQDENTCCENITEHLQVDEETQLKKLTIALDLNFAVALFHIFTFGSDFFFQANDEKEYFSSPPLLQELHILYETYLI